MHALVLVAGPDKGRVFRLEEGQTLVIGRGQASDTRINDPSMSRVHCRAMVDNGAVWLVDAGSSTGVIVNGEKTDKVQLTPGDVFQLGDSQMRYQLESTAEASTLVGDRVFGRPRPKPAVAPLQELVGQSLHSYRLDEIITAGRSGMVFKASDTEGNRPAAVKVLTPNVADSEEQKERFVRAMKTMMPNCPLPALPAGEIEARIVDQVRTLLRHPDLVARTHRELQGRAAEGPCEEATARLAELGTRRDQTRQSIRTLLSVTQPDDDFLAAELKRLKGELRWLERSIRHLESAATSVAPVELSRITDALQRIDPVWDLLYPEEQHRVLQLLIEQIRVFQDRIEVCFRSNGIEQIVEELPPADAAEPLTTSTTAHTCRNSSPAKPTVTICREDGAVVVHIPVHFRRRNGRQMILTCDGQQHPARQDHTVNSALVSAVAKAYHWQEQLESGQYASLEELAAAHGVDRSYVGRILRLTSLSPEIVEAIVDGNEPQGLTLAKLRKKLPLIWAEQKWD